MYVRVRVRVRVWCARAYVYLCAYMCVPVFTCVYLCLPVSTCVYMCVWRVCGVCMYICSIAHHT